MLSLQWRDNQNKYWSRYYYTFLLLLPQYFTAASNHNQQTEACYIMKTTGTVLRSSTITTWLPVRKVPEPSTTFHLTWPRYCGPVAVQLGSRPPSVIRPSGCAPVRQKWDPRIPGIAGGRDKGQAIKSWRESVEAHFSQNHPLDCNNTAKIDRL